MENLDLGLNLGFINDENLDKLLVTLTLLENGINSLNSTDDTVNIFSSMLKNAVRLKQELIDIKDIYEDINKSNSGKSAGSNSKDREDLNSTILDLTQQIKTLIDVYKSTQSDRRKGRSDTTGSTGTGRSRKPSYEEDTELDKINNELRQNAKAYRKDYSNKRNLNTTDVFRKLSEDNVRALKEQLNMFEGLTKEVVNKLSDTNFNNIISNGFIKKIQEISSKTDKSNDYYSSVSKLISDISKQTGNDDFKNLSKIKNAIKQEELNVLRNNMRVDNYKNMRKYGKENIDDTFFNSVKDFSKAIKESENEIKLYKKKLYDGKLNDSGLQLDLDKLKNKNKYSFNEKVEFEKRLNDYFQQNATKINNQGSYIDNLRQTASTVFFTKEMLGYIGNISQFNDAKNFEKNMTSLGVSGGFNSRGAVNSEKSTLMQMTEKTGTNVNEMASSLREVIKTGRDYNQSVELVKNATLLASTSFEDVSTSIDILNSKLLALDMNIDSNSIKRISNKIYNVLDNTALDLQDIANAGKQTNPILNSMVDSAESKGRLQNKTIDEYKEQLIDIEQSFIGELRQQGKTGEQAGTVIRNLFTKMMSVDGIAGKMLDRDLMKVSEEKLNKAGFRSAKELSDLWQSGDIEKALNGLSMLVSEGDITFSTIKKMVTERHSSSVVSVFNKINGDLEKFIKNMTEGKDLTEKNAQAMNNWSTSVDRLVNSIKNIGIASLTKGTNGAIFGGLTGVANLVSGMNEKTINSNNPILRSIGLSFPQGLQQGILMKGIGTQTRKFGVGNVNEAFKMAQERITDPEKLKEMIESKNEILARLSENKGFKGFIKNLDLASRSTENLADSFVDMAEKGTLSFENLKVGSSGLLSTLGSILKPTLYMMAINFVINSAMEYYNSLKKVQEELDNLDESIEKTAELGTSISNLKENIKNLTDVETSNQKEFNYSKFIDNMISSNDKLKESFEALNNIKNTTFKSFSDIRKEMFDKYTKKEDINTSPAIYQTGRFSIQGGIVGKKSDKDLFGSQQTFIIKEGNGLSPDGKTTRNELNMLQGTIYNSKKKEYINVNNKYIEALKNDKELQQILSGIQSSDNFNFKLSNGKNLVTKIKENDVLKSMKFTDKNGFTIDLKDIKDENISYAYNSLFKNIKIETKYKELKQYEKKFDEYVSGLNTSAKSRIGKDKYSKLDDNSKIKEMLKEGEGKLPEFIVRATLKNQDLAKEVGEVNDLEKFNKYLNGFEGNTLEEKYQNMVQTIVSTSQDKQTMNYVIAWAKEGFNAIKQSYEEYYKQLDTFRQYRDSILEQINQSKQGIREIFLNKGLRNVVAEDMFTERRNAKNELISLDKAGLSKYNNQFRKEVASIDSGTIQNNPQAFMNFQASLKNNLGGQAELDYQIKQAEMELEKEKKKNIQEDIEMAENKITYLKQTKKLLEDEVPIIKQQLAMSQFNIKTIKELAEMSAQIQSKQAEIRNQVGVSFGNRGSSMQMSYDILNAQRSAFNKYGKMGLQTQINSALSFDAGGKFLKEVTGKSNYANVGMGDYLKIQKQIESYNKQVANTDMSKLSDEDKKKLQEKADNLQRTGGIISSVLSETMALEEKRLEFAQREKQLKIDIVKYWLEEQKLKTEFVESGEIYTNENKQGSLPIIRKMTSGDNDLYRMNDLQEVTNLKLENSNLRMKDQLDYARRQIAVAKENAQRQINAIRRLEGTNSTNSRKSDSVAKTNTNVTNKTIVDSANSISNNLVNALNSMMESMSAMSMGGGEVEGDESNNPNIPTNASNHQRYLANKNYLMEAQKRTGISAGLLGAVASAESGFNPKANGGGKADVRGIMQIRPKDWNDFYKVGKKYGVSATPSYMNNQQAILAVASRFANNRDNGYFRGLGISNPQPIHYYMTHFLGEGGFRTLWRKYMNVPAMPHKDMEAAARANHSIFYDKNGRARTGNQIMAEMNRRMTTAYKSYGIDVALGGSVGKGVSGNYQPQKVNAQLIKTNQQQYTGGYIKDTRKVISGASGLRMKDPKENTGGGKITQSTYDFAKLVQANIKGFNQFTAFNDKYHTKLKYHSKHLDGIKFDFTIKGGKGASYSTVNQLKQLAAKSGYDIQVLNEYDKPSKNASGGHIDVQVNGRKKGSGGVNGLQALNIDVNMPEEYIPNMSEGTEKLIREITNNDFTKDMIKSQAEEEAATSIAMKYKELFDNSDDHVKSREMLNNWWNEYVLAHPNVDLSVSKDIARSVLDREKTLLDTARDTYDKIVNQFIENVKSLTYSFEEMELKVKDVNSEWERNYNFLTRNKLADTMNDFTKSIETNNAKISSLTRQLAKDIEINPSVISLFKYLEDNLGVKLETQEDRYNFMLSNDKLLPIAKKLEETMFDLAKEQFENLSMDKFSFQQLSKEEKQNLLNKAYTDLKKQGETNDDIFQKSQNFDNQTVMYKRLTEQIERNNEVHRAEADNFKLFNKSIEDLSAGIKELSDKMFNLENVRNLNTILEEVKLLSKGVDLDSVYGKKQMAFIKAENNKKLLEESKQSVRTLLKSNSITISALEMAGFNRDDLKNVDLNNFKNVQKLIEGISNFTETQNQVAKEQFNKFLDENPQLEKYRNINIFNKESLKELKEQLLKDDSIDNTKALEMNNFLDNLENGFVKFDDIVNALQKLVTVIKDSNMQFIEMFKHFSSKSVDMLSSILFGTDFEWKGLDYKESLNYLFGMLADDSKNIKRKFYKFFNIPQEDENIIKQDYTNSNRPDSLKKLNKVYIGENDFRTLMLNKLDNFDLNNSKQDNIYLDEKGNISRVYSFQDDFNNDLINMLKSDRVNKINVEGEDVLPELEETGKINLYRIKTNEQKTKVWLENAFTNVKKYERDVVGSLDETIQNINSEITAINKTSRDKIGEDKLQKIIAFDGISTLNTPNYTAYFNQELRVVDDFEKENDRFKRENEKNLINSYGKISEILKYNSEDKNKEINEKNVKDLLYMYERLQKPIGEGNGISFKTDKDNNLVYKILSQVEKNIEVGTVNNVTAEKLPNGISYKVNGKEVYKILHDSLHKKTKKGTKGFVRVYTVDDKNKKTVLWDFYNKLTKKQEKLIDNKEKEILNDLKQKYPNTKTTKKVTETELEPYYNVKTNTFYDDNYKNKNKIKIQYEGSKEKANNLYYTQNTESTNKYTDTTKNYGLSNSLFVQNIEDLKTLAGLIDPSKITSYQRASKGMVSKNTTINASKGTVSTGKKRLRMETDEKGNFINYIVDDKKVGTLGIEHPTTTTTTGKGKNKKTKTTIDEKLWQIYFTDETGKKTVYDKNLTSSEETEKLFIERMKAKDNEMFKKYDMDNPTPQIEKSTNNNDTKVNISNSKFSKEYVDMLKRYEAFNEYVNSKEFIDTLKDKREDKETQIKKINAWTKSFEILGDKNAKFTALQTIYESSWKPFEKSRIARGYNFGGLTTPTKWGIEGKSNIGKDGQGHAVFRDMGTGIAGRLIYGYTEKAYKDLMYKGGNFSNFYENYYGKYVGHDLPTYVKDLTNMGKKAGINFKDNRVPSEKGKNPFDLIPLTHSKKGFKDVDDKKIFEDLKKYREDTGDYSKFDIDNIKKLQSYTKQYNDSVMMATSVMKDTIIDTSKGKYLSVNDVASDIGDVAVQQYVQDNKKNLSTDNKNQETVNKVISKEDNEKFTDSNFKKKRVILYAGHDQYDQGAEFKGLTEYKQGLQRAEYIKNYVEGKYGKYIEVIITSRPKGAGSEEKNMEKGDVYASLHQNDDNGDRKNKIATNKQYGQAIVNFDKNSGKMDEIDYAFGKDLVEANIKAGFMPKGSQVNINKQTNGKGKVTYNGTYFPRLVDKINGSNKPAVLMELGYINNPEYNKFVDDNNKKFGEVNGEIFVKYAFGEKDYQMIKQIVENPEQQPQKVETEQPQVVENQQPVQKTETNNENQQPIQDIHNYGGNFAELVRQREIERQKEENEKRKEEREQKFQKPFAYTTTLVTVIDGMMKRELNYKKKALEVQAKILEMNLQMADTTEERRRIEEQILQNKLANVDNEYKTQSTFLGGMFGGTSGFVLQGALGGATQGASVGGVTGALVGTGLGFVGGLLGGTQAKIQAEQQKSQLIAQQKLTWLAEDRNRYLKTMANAMSEQAKWTTKIGVNDAISRSVRFALTGKEVLGGTAYETRTVGKRKKKAGGLLGSKKYDTAEAFTQSYNLNDSMFGGRQFDNRMDLEFAYSTLAQKLIDMRGLIGLYGNYANPVHSFFGRFASGGAERIRQLPIPRPLTDNGLNEYLQRRLSDGSRELTASEFIKYFNGQGTLQGDGLLVDRSRDNEIDDIINNLKETAKAMPTGQQKVDTLALINFYENIKAVLDKEGKTTKRLFGNYYGYKCNTSVTYSHYVIKVA